MWFNWNILGHLDRGTESMMNLTLALKASTQKWHFSGQSSHMAILTYKVRRARGLEILGEQHECLPPAYLCVPL